MIVEFVATNECGMQYGDDFVRPLNNFRDWVNESLVITRLMPFDRWKDRRYDIRRAALLRKKNLNARAGGLRRFDKDESVFVRDDHGTVVGRFRQLAERPSRRQAADACKQAACAPRKSVARPVSARVRRAMEFYNFPIVTWWPFGWRNHSGNSIPLGRILS